MVRLRRIVLASAACLFGFATAVATAQQCSQIEGNWVDNYSYGFALTHTGATTVEGAVAINHWACGIYPWYASGYIFSNGSLSITAQNLQYPFPDPDICAESFTYSGPVHRGGCNVASGTWTNPSGANGNFTMTKQCEIPAGETTAQDSGLWFNTFYHYCPNVAECC